MATGSGPSFGMRVANCVKGFVYSSAIAGSISQVREYRKAFQQVQRGGEDDEQARPCTRAFDNRLPWERASNVGSR